ncbi:hypothetical protein BAUCODRAFT_31681 [Baudoinia panamericana UAMH 10762]|uniref:NAD(P)-binding protein n=1 Tax=Baudoinia panamericana (strain UAMH 10762) TaxID=717646 RepID=M2N5Q4_BAUPA|nr:uncharacterized protein BAUCODRAFT_31681 [Baudoinia panamericana UAMH 10762]EMC99363.1 hypothetical protein BAUCODRAFT_31681 [Baudoinia panamericana UAMH 10762]
MPTAIVTGANSGIGHAFAHILIREGWEVHACDLQIGEKLQSLTAARLHRLDVRAPESISSFAEQLSGKPVDVLLNVAGVEAPVQQDTLETVNMAVLRQTFEVNTFGPLLLTQAVLPNIFASQAQPPRIGIVSSRVGSIADNTTSTRYAYRSSKAAVNSIGKSMSCDLKDRGVVVSLLHPGITRTNLLSDMNIPGAVEPEEAASKLWKVFMSKGLEETGMFWHRDGFEFPW